MVAMDISQAAHASATPNARITTIAAAIPGRHAITGKACRYGFAPGF